MSTVVSGVSTTPCLKSVGESNKTEALWIISNT